MKKESHVFFSNKTEILYQYLKEKLFKSVKNIFQKRLIIVPDATIKTWLTMEMAKDHELGIAMGYKILYLEEGLWHFHALFPTHGTKKSPSFIQLALTIERELQNVNKKFHTFNPDEKERWDLLITYLKKGPSRLTSLSCSLAEFFDYYAQYGFTMLETWESGLSSHGWQESLWLSLFGPNGEWTFLNRELKKLIDENKEDIHEPIDIHLFGFHYLNSIHLDFFNHLNRQFSLYFYQFSPCQLFWSDILSNKESIKLQNFLKRLGAHPSQLMTLEGYLRESNPLLANWGMLGRKMIEGLEEMGILSTAMYALPKAIETNIHYTEDLSPELLLIDNERDLTLLECVQADILLLKNSNPQMKKSFTDNDLSLQVHRAQSKRQEVEILYNALLHVMKINRELNLSDLIVVAPSLAEYTPFIKAVFNAADSHFPAIILQEQAPFSHPYIQAFWHLLCIADSRWETSSILKLFSFYHFQQRHQLTEGDIFRINTWVREGGVRWGYNEGHRDEILKKSHCPLGMSDNSPIGTWESTLDRLFFGMVHISSEQITAIPAKKFQEPQNGVKEDSPGLGNPEGMTITLGKEDLAGIAEQISEHIPLFPLMQVSTSETDLLTKWDRLLFSLKEDLCCLNDGTLLSLREWIDYLDCLKEAYFKIEKQNEGYIFLTEAFEKLKSAIETLDTHLFSFHTVKHHLEMIFSQPRASSHLQDLNVIRFHSLKAQAILPAKVIAFLGLEDGKFPRSTSSSSLDLLKIFSSEKRIPYFPTHEDSDRYLFLETLLSAREHFLIFYTGFSTEENKEQSPSLLITELMNYLDGSYLVKDEKPSKQCTYLHPFHSFDPSYFSTDKSFPNYSPFHFQIAESQAQAEKIEAKNFISSFIITAPTLSPEESIKLNLRDLSSFARNPVKAYFNKSLGIYLEDFERRMIKEVEDFSTSPLQNFIIKKDLLKLPVEVLLHHAEKKGLLPIGPFKGINIEKIKEEALEVNENLDALKINPKEFFRLNFHRGCDSTSVQSNGNWELPVLQIPYNGSQIFIEGELFPVCSQGLVAIIKLDKIDLLKIWPQYLLTQCLAKQFDLKIASQLLALKGPKGKVKSLPLEDPFEHLVDYLDFYFESLQHPSPLIPEWIQTFCSHDESEIQDKIRYSLKNPFQPLKNPYMQWALQHQDPKGLFHWKSKAEKLFSPLFEEKSF